MIRVTLLLGGLLALCTAALIQTRNDNIIKGCQSETELWGLADCTKFAFCLGNDTALVQSCDPGTLFIKNATVCGCIPLAEVDDSCVYHVEPPICEGENLTQPKPHTYPTHFYFCPKQGDKPVVLSCPDNKAFIVQDGYLGCFEWEMWRDLRGCRYSLKNTI